MSAAQFKKTPDPGRNARAEVPPHIATLVAQCLEKEPARRPQTARDLLYALDPEDKVPLATGRPRLVVIAGALAALVLLAVVAIVARRGGGVSSAEPAARSLPGLPFVHARGDP